MNYEVILGQLCVGCGKEIDSIQEGVVWASTSEDVAVDAKCDVCGAVTPGVIARPKD